MSAAPLSEAENWRPVPGWEDLYSVSDLGRVRSETARGRWPAGMILRPGRHRGGHLQVGLCRPGERRWMFVHRLVMAAFVGECPPGMEVRHLDGNPANNAPSNLEYGTRNENRLDCHRHGARVGAQKLTLAQVAEIRRRLAAGESQRSIARAFGVHPATISRINTDANWTHRLDQTSDLSQLQKPEPLALGAATGAAGAGSGSGLGSGSFGAAP